MIFSLIYKLLNNNLKVQKILLRIARKLLILFIYFVQLEKENNIDKIILFWDQSYSMVGRTFASNAAVPGFIHGIPYDWSTSQTGVLSEYRARSNSYSPQDAVPKQYKKNYIRNKDKEP